MRLIKITTIGFCLIHTTLMAQTKSDMYGTLPLEPTKLTRAHMEKIAKMSPAELEKYQAAAVKYQEEKAKQLAKAGNISLDESFLQSTGIQPPVKDVQRLSLIPAIPPSRVELARQMTAMAEGLTKMSSKEDVQNVETYIASHTAKEINSAAIGSWYQDKHQAALLLAVKSAIKQPEDITNLNNTAALFNMAGLQHRAIPILQHCLAQRPNNSMLLNNMGQAYLGLGDLNTASQHLTRCLSIDAMNPEANRSMAMISLYNKEYEKAAQYFANEFEMTQRRSSMAQLVKSGNRDKIDMAALYKKRMQRQGSQRDFFEEIALSKFQLPEFPTTTEATASMLPKHKAYQKSASNELQFWFQMATSLKENNRHKNAGNYHDLVNELLDDLHKTYEPLIQLFREEDLNLLREMHDQYAKQLLELKEPWHENPTIRAKLICDQKKPVHDQYMARVNAFVATRYAIVNPRWKEYINALINIVQLDPTPSNQALVAALVSQYFNFLGFASSSGQFLYPPPSCGIKITDAEMAALLESNRNFKLECPDWLKLEIPVKVAKLKLDCNEFSIEANAYDLLELGIKKEFKTGSSTLWVGAGVDSEFAKHGKVELKGEMYVVWDQNNQFSDVGLRGSGKISVEQIGSAEMQYGFGLNSGFTSETSVKNNFAETLDKASGFIGK